MTSIYHPIHAVNPTAAPPKPADAMNPAEKATQSNDLALESREEPIDSRVSILPLSLPEKGIFTPIPIPQAARNSIESVFHGFFNGRPVRTFVIKQSDGTSAQATEWVIVRDLFAALERNLPDKPMTTAQMINRLSPVVDRSHFLLDEAGELLIDDAAMFEFLEHQKAAGDVANSFLLWEERGGGSFDAADEAVEIRRLANISRLNQQIDTILNLGKHGHQHSKAIVKLLRELKTWEAPALEQGVLDEF